MANDFLKGAAQIGKAYICKQCMQRRMYIENQIINAEIPLYDLPEDAEINTFSELQRDAEFKDDYNRVIYISNPKVDALEVVFD